jgi:hypothetical protein
MRQPIKAERPGAAVSSFEPSKACSVDDGTASSATTGIAPQDSKRRKPHEPSGIIRDERQLDLVEYINQLSSKESEPRSRNKGALP